MSAFPEPTARPVVIGACHWCAGQGQLLDEITLEMRACERCAATGSADEARLRAAYDCGREDALRDVLKHLADLRVMLGLALDAAEQPAPEFSYRNLRQRIGG